MGARKEFIAEAVRRAHIVGELFPPETPTLYPAAPDTEEREAHPDCGRVKRKNGKLCERCTPKGRCDARFL